MRGHPGCNQENRCRAQGLRRRDRTSATRARRNRRHFAQRTPVPDSEAVHKRTSAEPGKSFPAQCASVRAWANASRPPEMLGHRPAVRGACCEVPDCSHQTQPDRSSSLCKRTAASGTDHKDQESMPGRKCRSRRRLPGAVDFPPA